MTVLTIPKEYRQKELVLVPMDEYRELVDFRASFPEEIKLSPAGRKNLTQMRKDRKEGKMISFRSK